MTDEGVGGEESAGGQGDIKTRRSRDGGSGREKYSSLSDPYTIATYLLVLISIGSKIFLRLPYDCYILVKFSQEGSSHDNARVPFYEEEEYDNSIVTILMSYVDHSFIRIAILINMTRFIILSLSLNFQSQQ